ncbi:MAG: DUF559 domain-containing protein [Caulobacteraceae bacterium]|nr:DUF559 domain-containing protein [Caulobacteraceae bacterium]
MQVATKAAKSQARRMRKVPTSIEAKLWKLLRDRRLGGFKIRRQVPVGPYIADFLCFRHRLIIEADGPFHEDDERRDSWLRSQGFRILRFPNAQVGYDPDSVLATILRAVTPSGPAGATPHPTAFGGHLLPQGEGELTPRRFPIGLTLATAIAFSILIGLGAWQVKRLHWKENLLAQIAALQHAPPRPVGQALGGGPLGPQIDFTRVEADCPDIETTPFLTLFTVFQGRPGFRVIAACPLSAGPYHSILVDRGFIDQASAPQLKPGQGQRLATPIVGVLRRGDLRNFLTPQNQPAQGLWYWRDIPAMAAVLGAQAPAPTFLMLERPAPSGFGPTPAALPVDIPNNHLGYAMTWFGLAAGLLGVYLASLWRRLSD